MTNTHETQAPSNKVALSTPKELNYPAIVRRNAKRKVENGSQFSSVKGKTSLLLCCIDDVRSELGIAKFNDANQRNNIPETAFNELKIALNAFWQTEAQEIVSAALQKDAKITVRRGVLMTRFGKDNKLVRSKTDTIKAVHVAEAKEYKLCDMFGLSALQAKLDNMLDNPGKFDRTQFDTVKKQIELLEQAIDGAEKQ
jgi:hypothetical protein